MRVLQLIDSLRPGGAERMSINYANAMAKRIDASFLCCTRIEGLLKFQLSPEVGYLFLNKKRTLDPGAFLKLRSFVKKNRIDLIQAHSSSWFLAVFVKLSLPGVKLVWHDHYGRELHNRKAGALNQTSRFFDGIISVNSGLKKWAEENLKSKNVKYFRNFLPAATENNSNSEVKDGFLLKGEEGSKIICLANLRPQKDHLNLIKAFDLVLNEFPQTSLHLVGKDEEDSYSNGIKTFVKQKNLQEKIVFYGEQENIEKFLKEADLGVLSSASEGLPVALLEYGHTGLAVIVTEVGQCKEVVQDYGQVVSSGDPEALAMAILFYLKNDFQRRMDSEAFRKEILCNYSEDATLPKILETFHQIINKKD